MPDAQRPHQQELENQLPNCYHTSDALQLVCIVFVNVYDAVFAFGSASQSSIYYFRKENLQDYLGVLPQCFPEFAVMAGRILAVGLDGSHS